MASVVEGGVVAPVMDNVTTFAKPTEATGLVNNLLANYVPAMTNLQLTVTVLLLLVAYDQGMPIPNPSDKRLALLTTHIISPLLVDEGFHRRPGI
jgi:hypothetical protein